MDGFVAVARGLDAIELHSWHATIEEIEIADQIVLDLDPEGGSEPSFVAQAA